jgi:hypothetical protein
MADLPNRRCDDDAWSVLANWRSLKPVLETEYLNFLVQGDPVQASAVQLENGFKAPGREDLSFWSLKIPLEWNANPFKDTNWRFQVHAWRMLDPYVLAWLKTGDKRYMVEVLAIVQDWHRYHIIETLPSTYGWYDMAAGIRAMKLAFLLDRALRSQFELTVEDRRMLIELADAHVSKLTEPDFLSPGNHGLFQLHGLIAVCQTLPYLKGCSGALKYAEGEMNELLNHQFSAEGIHLENSPSYHFFVTDTVQKLIRSGWYEDFKHTKDLMRRAEANKVWMVHPDKRDITVGDSADSKHNLRFPKGSDLCLDSAWMRSECFLLQTFAQSGYAMVRSDWGIPESEASMLFFMASFHSANHKHADDMSFELFEFGERVLTDSGKYSYNASRFRDFAISTRAHNTLEINGQSFSLLPDDAYGSALKSTERRGNVFYLKGEIMHARLGVKHYRTLIFAPRQWLIVVDQALGEVVNATTQWFHFSPQIQLTSPIYGNDAENLYHATLRSGKKIQIEQYFPKCQGKIVFGQENPIQGWSTIAYGAMTPRYSLGFSCAGPQRAIATVFVLDDNYRAQAMNTADNVLREMGVPAVAATYSSDGYQN